MAKKDLEELNKYWREHYPHLLEHYKFLFDRRVTDYPKKFEFILVLTNLFLLIFIELLKNFLIKSSIFYIPLILLSLPTILFFIHAIPNRYWFPWFEREIHWKKYQQDRTEVYQKLWEDIYGTIPHICAVYERDKYLYKVLLNILVVAIFSPLIIFSYYYNDILCIVLSVALLSVLLFLVNYFLGKELIENPAPEVEKFFEKWKKEALDKS